ncbi:MAG TPA: hypothetical protein P5205_03005 [Candidatus Paceibacterota bacterium]|nr:hypothetical protein [Verrucomicrobiota bacterium]HSA09317.1 hypothetical protein [Candidatus Paceibacterota bacterium]
MKPHALQTGRRGPRTTRRAGVALVITLVLLSIITFMAVTFLVVSRSQHGSVATETDQAIARLAADAARDRAIVEILAPLITWTNEYNYRTLVSTNFINPIGFDPGAAPVVTPNPTNVNYDYTTTGTPLSPNQRLQNIANLLYDPRPPVFITNLLAANSTEFRFYLDLNRNGMADPNGAQPVVVRDPGGALGFYDLSTNFIPYRWPPPQGILSNFFVGDPEWIGVLQRPEYAHSPKNLFTSRYAYFVVPAGQTLDMNYLHNNAKQLSMNSPGDGFLRNQGVLGAEMNLAAFLVDLNTNMWPSTAPNPYNFQYYSYNTNLMQASTGKAADDAAALLRYRYAGDYNNLARVSTLLPAGVDAFSTDFVDGYSAGPLMFGTWWPAPPDADLLRVDSPWSGADNPNRFYSTQDLFDQNKTRPPWVVAGDSFTDRLQMAGTNSDSYNRYTFYRLLSQLGTDSAPEPSGKMNLNYRNVINGRVVPNLETNFEPWIAEEFFTNAAIRLLVDAGYTVGDAANPTNTSLLVTNVVNGLLVTNLYIRVWPANFYTPSVHRIFQFAANMYDATTNRADLTNYPYLPTVFRPVFNVQNQGVFIRNYEEVTSAVSVLNATMVDLNNTNSVGSMQPYSMVYNVPLVIGARKNLPNFNEFAMHTHVQVTRKLQFRRASGATSPIAQTNQMFMVGISNVLGLEAWNSYVTNFTRPLRLHVQPDIRVVLTNENSLVLNPPPQIYTTNIVFITNNWLGYIPPFQDRASFIVPLATNLVFLQNSTYHHNPPAFVPATGLFEQVNPAFYVPHWGLLVKALLRFAIVDNDRIVDYVNLAEQNVVNLTDALTQGGECGTTYTPSGSYGSMWCTNHYPNIADENLPTYGIRNQLQVSLGNRPYFDQADWNSAVNDFPPGMGRTAAVDFFRYQFNLGPIFTHPPNTVFYKSNTFAAPYQPLRNIYLVTSWQANDPLVHYTTGDLTDLVRTNLVLDKFSSTTPDPVANLGQVNARYEPWGGNPYGGSSSPTIFDLTVKDPLMLRSDYWDFPANKLPNVGWLGRVHRGTPWQTVYLKSFGVSNFAGWFNNWRRWSGDGQVVVNVGQLATNLVPINNWVNDAAFMQPNNDGRLLDLFTSALNNNATRGQLSINQTNLAAWSAVLSGVITLTNDVDAAGKPILAPAVIQPAGVYDAFDTNTWPPTVRLVHAINAARANTNAPMPVYPNHVFRRLGDILSVPELTVASPFLNLAGTPSLANNGLNDAAYERLPQQIAGLLKVDTVPRFVIYAFGQTLKPTQPVPSGTFAGLCTNYQIMAESATRTVVRFEGIQPYERGLPPAINALHPVIESFNVLPPD